MKIVRVLLALLICAAAARVTAQAADESQSSGAQKVRVLVVTGGHDFEKEPFFQMFKDNPQITYRAVEHPNAHALLTADAAKAYDVLVLYDMHQEITDAAKADFVARLKEGKGSVVVHHAIASYQTWPEYNKIIGARYYLAKTVVDGVEKARSAYKHDVNFKIHVVGNHPVTAGLKAFDVHDETYKLFDVADGVQPLLTTEEPESNPVVAWAKTYEASRVVYIQLGHDHFVYQNPNYRQLLKQAIAWTAQKD